MKDNTLTVEELIEGYASSVYETYETREKRAREAIRKIRAEAFADGADSTFYNPEIRGFIDYSENPYKD